jgi:thymidine phosphorylase
LVNLDARLDDVVRSLYRRVLAEPSAPMVAELATRLAASGTVRDREPTSVDLASTGGPSSLSTVLGPLMLAARGCQVPKLGVPGRPAGGIDVLGTVSGYRTTMSPASFDDVLASCGYAHAAAGGTWAPADGALFLLRQAEGYQAVSALVVASLVAKKLAAGVSVAGLEGRVAPHGNFGTTLAEARVAADLYCAVCRDVGLSPVVVLTDASVPFQPFVGRGEAIVAVEDVLSGLGGPWLDRHVALCEAMTSRVAASVATARPGDIELPDVRSVHERNLTAQGSSPEAWDRRVEEARSAPRVDVVATTTGFVRYDLGALREFLLELRQPPTGETPRGMIFDDSAGAVLLAEPRTLVATGQPVMSLRGLTAATPVPPTLFEIAPEPAAPDNTVLEVVS